MTESFKDDIINQPQEPRAYTADEVRDMLLERLVAVARYWADLPETDRATGRTFTLRDRCEGVLFSVLVTLDGESIGLPGFDLVPTPHPDDKAYHQSQGENWIELGTVISDTLHEHLGRFAK